STLLDIRLGCIGTDSYSPIPISTIAQLSAAECHRDEVNADESPSSVHRTDLRSAAISRVSLHRAGARRLSQSSYSHHRAASSRLRGGSAGAGFGPEDGRAGGSAGHH